MPHIHTPKKSAKNISLKIRAIIVRSRCVVAAAIVVAVVLVVVDISAFSIDSVGKCRHKKEQLPNVCENQLMPSQAMMLFPVQLYKISNRS